MDGQAEFNFDTPKPPPRGRVRTVPPAPDTPPRIYTISGITGLIKATLEEELRGVWVEGEISNLRRMASGHTYFTLKDNRAQLSAVLFAGAATAAARALADGMTIRAQGEVSVYEPRGQYQLIVRKFEAAGAGANMLEFEALKNKLKAEGLFDPERKRRLPAFPRHIGIVTSPTGAAIEDMLNILGRRFASVRITLAPARVQGEGAARELAEGLRLLATRPGTERPDVIIIGRGGGSVEDLWCFNDEALARAVAASPVPVVSAVGHETDFTLCDFTADLRAPTPSAAAELVVGRKEDFEAQLRQLGRRLAQALQGAHARAKARLDVVMARRAFREPGRMAEPQAQHLDRLELRFCQAMERFPQVLKPRVATLTLRLEQSAAARVKHQRMSLQAAERHLAALNPLAVLQRGYSLTYLADGMLVRSATEVAPGAGLRTRLGDGCVESTAADT